MRCGTQRRYFRGRDYPSITRLRCNETISLIGTRRVGTRICRGRYKTVKEPKKERGVLLKDVSPTDILVLGDKLKEEGCIPYLHPEVIFDYGGSATRLFYATTEQRAAIRAVLGSVFVREMTWDHTERKILEKVMEYFSTPDLWELLLGCGITNARKYAKGVRFRQEPTRVNQDGSPIQKGA
jgi:hypothetical protein